MSSTNVKTRGLAEADLATPEIDVPHRQAPISPVFFAVRASRDDGAALIRDARAAVCAVDCDLALTNMLPMDARIGVSLRTQRFRMMMIVAFAALAGLLACLGVYAIRSRAMAARVREMGIRIALGARSWQVLALAVSQGLRLVGIGLAVGLVGSILLATFISPWLFDTRATDPLVIVLALIMLGGAALIASWLPARRAS